MHEVIQTTRTVFVIKLTLKSRGSPSSYFMLSISQRSSSTGLRILSS